MDGNKSGSVPYFHKYTPDAVALLPEVRHWVLLYGKWQWVRYRSAACLAKFLRGHKVRALWMQFEDEDGKLSKPRLLISTNSNLSADELFKDYSRRWAIEDLFNQMKNGWGWSEAWQQSRQVLHRWTQILSTAYALPQLLAIYCGQQMNDLLQLTPWRKKAPVTAGPSSTGPAVVFQQCSGAGLVEPNMPEIRTRLSPCQPRQNRSFGKKRMETAVKEQQGGLAIPATVMVAL